MSDIASYVHIKQDIMHDIQVRKNKDDTITYSGLISNCFP